MMNRNNFRGGSRHPVDVGQELDVKIEAAGAKGDGVAKIKGYVLFVPNTQPGDKVHIKVTRVLKSVGFAESMGPAQGPVVQDERSEEQEDKSDEETANDDSDNFEEEAPADSEDFGEDSETDEEFEETDDDEEKA